jgi:hypothetical protein
MCPLTLSIATRPDQHWPGCRLPASRVAMRPPELSVATRPHQQSPPTAPTLRPLYPRSHAPDVASNTSPRCNAPTGFLCCNTSLPTAPQPAHPLQPRYHALRLSDGSNIFIQVCDSPAPSALQCPHRTSPLQHVPITTLPSPPTPSTPYTHVIRRSGFQPQIKYNNKGAGSSPIPCCNVLTRPLHCNTSLQTTPQPRYHALKLSATDQISLYKYVILPPHHHTRHPTLRHTSP